MSILKKFKNTIIKDNENINDPGELPIECQKLLEVSKKCESPLTMSFLIKTKEDPTLKLQKKLQIIGRKTKKFRIRKKIVKRLANLYGDY